MTKVSLSPAIEAGLACHLLRFDLLSEHEWPAFKTEIRLTATRHGVCQGVAQWLRLELDDEHFYERAPDAKAPTAGRHWAPVWYPLESPVTLEAGQSLTFAVTSNRVGVRVELEAPR